ncbi:hypothetical protein N9A89_05245 [Akkermansiaceae bacterium]|nr:hypothetical protein [Akkermansiaceae bacterium]MDB4041414.1 hypothetical protein [Akkermansiaceae bacterium]MDB4506625.1 hypothetical protein [Akkermansiaceae bacterium]MDB4547486.1 hypothetical protein [Akkermansiaceae bacterium]
MNSSLTFAIVGCGVRGRIYMRAALDRIGWGRKGVAIQIALQKKEPLRNPSWPITSK